RHPACRWREPQPCSCKERENLAGDAKGKGSSGANRKAESTDTPERGGLLRSSEEAAVMVAERRGRVIDAESGQLATGGARSSTPLIDGTSRMMREYQVRICERLRVSREGPGADVHRPRAHEGSPILAAPLFAAPLNTWRYLAVHETEQHPLLWKPATP